MPEIETIEAPATSESREAFPPLGVAQIGRDYHASPAFTEDMSAAFRNAAQQAQIENAQLDEAP